MCWGEVQLMKDANGTEYLQYCAKEMQTKFVLCSLENSRELNSN